MPMPVVGMGGSVSRVLDQWGRDGVNGNCRASRHGTGRGDATDGPGLVGDGAPASVRPGRDYWYPIG